MVDENGNILEKGYRKRGPEKNHRPDPIVELGLLMDSNGIPLSYDLFPGNDSEKTSLLPILKRTKSKFGIDKVIVVASLGKLGGEVPYTTYMSKKSYLSENKDIIGGFTKAIQKGLNYVFTHTDNEVAEVITSYFPDTSINDLTLVIKRYRAADSWYRTTYITEEGFDRVQDIMDNSGKLDKRAHLDKLVNNDYNKK